MSFNHLKASKQWWCNILVPFLFIYLFILPNIDSYVLHIHQISISPVEHLWDVLEQEFDIMDVMPNLNLCHDDLKHFWRQKEEPTQH